MILGTVEVPPLQNVAPAIDHPLEPAAGQELSGPALASLCAAVAAETGIPEGRVRKVIQAVQRHQQAGRPSTSPPATQPGDAPDSPVDRLRFYPLGANGRLRPPQAHVQTASSSQWPA